MKKYLSLLLVVSLFTLTGCDWMDNIGSWCGCSSSSTDATDTSDTSSDASDDAAADSSADVDADSADADSSDS